MKGKPEEKWPKFAVKSVTGSAVVRFCVILSHVKDRDRKAASQWCDIRPECISNEDYAKVVDNQLEICRSLNEQSKNSAPVQYLLTASVDQKAELTKSALAVAALGHNWMTYMPNDSAADWVDGTYFKGDLPD